MSLRNQVIAELERGPASTVEIAERLNSFPWVINSYCTRMAKTGEVNRSGARYNGSGRATTVWALSR